MNSHRDLCNRAKDILAQYVADHSGTAPEICLQQLVRLFDGPDQRAIDREWPKNAFVEAFKEVQTAAHQNSINKGFWDSPEKCNLGEKLALTHGELSEALEALRDGNPMSVKVPDFTHVEEELADAVIRIMDMGGRNSWRIAQAIIAKMEYNSGRPFMHGRNF